MLWIALVVFRLSSSEGNVAPITCRRVWKTNDFVVLYLILQQVIVLPHYAGI